MGSLDFEMINAVNEGTTSTFILLLVGVFAGNQIYHMEVYGGIMFFEIAFSFILGGVIIQMLIVLYKLFRYKKTSDVLQKLLLFVMLNVSFFVVVCFSNSHVIISQQKILMYTYTFLFSKIVISIMISHVFDSNFNQLQIFPIFIMFMLMALTAIESLVDLGKKI